MSVHVIGAGGHAKVIVALIEAGGGVVGGVYDDDPARIGQALLGHPIAPMAALPTSAVVVIAIGNNRARLRVATALQEHEAATLVHPTAWVAPSSVVGPGSVLFAGSIVQPDCRIGAHVIVNTAASIDHDNIVGDFAHIAPGCHLAGDVHLASGVFLGVGVSVIPGRRLGAWSTVGAGGVVVDDIGEGVVVKGIPAR
jgi:sugar O-acyltransferase (sialic acid O-acetyltransferase NeuD family)